MITFTVPTGDPDGAAFMRDLYKRYSRLMYATVLRSIPNSQDCEDIVQDAVESLCKKVHTLMTLPSPALTVYIVYTVKNKVSNCKRHQSVVNKHIMPMAGTNLEDLESTVPTPEALVELKEQVEALYRVWSRLPDQDRDLLYRKYVLKQDNEELAEFLRCKPDSVRMRLTRAKRKVAALMEGDDGNDRTRTLA
nr:sigma-70 family RNA polymerase sigma factor [uncultured Oscillibacter sp.]